ncbi:hypothetical protein D7X33_43335 [Butyricicoccus sp. 1XD8-22]|nr:hypothetical protein D7X33_43335 [Butyricicoccus sp. 1XD8-22]
MHEKGDEDMLAPEITLPRKKSLKKQKVKKNKFANLSPQDWKDSNESTKSNRGINGLNYEDIWR